MSSVSYVALTVRARIRGFDSFHLLDREAVRAEVHSPLYLGGVWVTGGGILDPVKLVDGLLGEAERLGVRVFERSHVAAVEPAGAATRVRGDGGEVVLRVLERMGIGFSS